MDISIKEIEPKFDYHQLLLSWFSPNFPIGSYNFSHGLEAAIEMNYIRDIVCLENWINYLINCGSAKTKNNRRTRKSLWCIALQLLRGSREIFTRYICIRY